MGRSGDAAYFQTLADGLKSEKEDNIPSLLYGLGMLGDKRAVSVLKNYLDHPQDRVRSIAAAALGQLQDPGSKEILKKSLTDIEPNVQWSTAIALAKLGDDSGKPILLKLLDRQYFSSFPEVDSVEQTHLILAAINSSVSLQDSQISEAIRELSRSDKNMKVRAAALNYFDQTK
jgi:HEAT repeat protein